MCERGCWLHGRLGWGVELSLASPAAVSLTAPGSRKQTCRVCVAGPTWEIVAGKLSHFGLYALLIVLPGTGIAMNWVSGRGVPLFTTTVNAPFAITPKPEVAKTAFWVHSKAGQVLEYVVPLHIGAVGYHAVKGTNVLKRLWPFA